mmetsp:Transcript_10110/g.17604  ORF Transcript_10110/g.17604 Transcript_10110/m.17604 type:complete len:157 (+) Transcript_10110:60-530(+)|eukprot:CAMPEP_0119108954 /NCGR_PEP_ID=MMETSP1180-20130426/16402_1 /TAXON_ID=3052 ORGANISM="Chlamydomonas cf sp, Strain CCMP681" /NCGR_SAMPLE_ID=MMETSP1180 /ASSEMBLY_ACC=CAM_ASM_000741 /LENGTH=156 /DNA_ID=CAMNT_0007094641 /DNA_START=60 /DNA_END=530 /DNA_ORIENTATION=+
MDALAPVQRHQFRVGEGDSSRTVYEWDQTFTDVNLYVQVPPGTPGKGLFCDIQVNSIKLGLKLNPPYLQGQLSGPVKVSDSVWTLEGGTLMVTLSKAQPGEPWPSVIQGQELDPATQQAETKRLMLERFQNEHPGFDFSGATFNGQAPNPRTFMNK